MNTTSKQVQACMICGQPLSSDDNFHATAHGIEVPVCCSGATYDDGTHDDATCVACCPPHPPFRPGIVGYAT